MDETPTLAELLDAQRCDVGTLREANTALREQNAALLHDNIALKQLVADLQRQLSRPPAMA